MKDFVLLFRQPSLDYSKIPAKEMQGIVKKWEDWVGGIGAQGKLKQNGMRLAAEGKVLKAGGVITDGPFVEIREILGSFLVVRADSLEEATTLAHGCPALDTGGSVEIRPVFG
ncbi:MAG: YciI family protein [Bacteroidota bacterium]|nr:YciI family protein [Bacteroidota bacterium]MDP4251606.1 YciI family protein [Bacteroidota bacterium]